MLIVPVEMMSILLFLFGTTNGPFYVTISFIVFAFFV